MLLTTGYSPDEEGDAAPVSAPDDVPLLRKPYTEQQLARDVRRLLDDGLAA